MKSSISKQNQILTSILTLYSDLPILQGGQRRQKARKTQMARGAIMLSGMLFFFSYTRMGILNRILVSLSTSKICSFL
jgi:hypothetical protein